MTKQTKKSLIKTGNQVGNWEVLAEPTTRKVHVLCKVCNQTTREIDYTILLNDKLRSSSCGCLAKQKSKRNNIKENSRFGYLVVKQPNQPNQRKVLCECNCGSLVEVDYTRLLNGETKSCGCQSNKLRQQTCEDKYGYKHTLESPVIRDQIKQTNTQKYGGTSPAQSEQIKDKMKQTNLTRHGVDNFAKTQKFKHQMRIQSPLTLSTGQPIVQVCDDNQVSKSQAYKVFHEYGEKVFLEYCENYDKHIYSTELAFIDLIKDTFPNLPKYDKTPLEFKINRRPDFRLELNGKILYINVDGLFDHMEGGRRGLDKNYHFDLHQDFQNNNINIFQFRQDELRDQPQVVRSIVCNYFGIHKQLFYARNCFIQKISNKQAQEFYNNNHLMKHSPIASHYGLFCKNTKLLVSCMSVKQKGAQLEIVRFCSSIDTKVSGAFSKLLNSITKQHKCDKILSFCDLRYSTGKSYRLLGFELVQTKLGWSWTDRTKVFNRLKCRANMDNRRLSEKQHAQELRWFKIYDAGQAKYIKNIQK